MNIALIGAGIDSIPSKKFGALEMVLWNYKIGLEKIGHQAAIFNDQDLKAVAAQINAGGFDLALLNYSEYVSFFSRKLTIPLLTNCQSGYITNRKKWSIGYHSVFYDTMRGSGIIASSPEIMKLYADAGFSGFVRVLRNGIDTENFTLQEKGNDRAVCLGRIEPRKRQAWLAKTVAHTVDLDFVGPIQDENFGVEGRCRYQGYWMKEEVYEKLSAYSCLVLLSDGEAAPLVVPEALAAGLSVVVSKSAAANLDERLPFVSILPDEISDPEIPAQAINAQIKNNAAYRPEIIAYAKSYFDNRAVVADLVGIMEEFQADNHEARKGVAVPVGKLPIYLLSKFALLAKSFLRMIRVFMRTANPAAS